MMNRSLCELTNIGETVAARLGSIGVTSESTLREVGSAEVYRRLSESCPEKHFPVCYYLYSLEGAIQGRHWSDFSEGEKKDMRLAAGC
ncbi:MAG: competence protein TfoX [Gammaproteobacteria bacterium]|nr:competence protein TfoX [Gammaproteobacteria bacterium]